MCQQAHERQPQRLPDQVESMNRSATAAASEQQPERSVLCHFKLPPIVITVNWKAYVRSTHAKPSIRRLRKLNPIIGCAQARHTAAADKEKYSQNQEEKKHREPKRAHQTESSSVPKRRVFLRRRRRHEPWPRRDRGEQMLALVGNKLESPARELAGEPGGRKRTWP